MTRAEARAETEGGELSEAVLEELRQLEAEWRDAASCPKPPRPRYAVGAAVAVTAGLFAGRRGRVQADDGATVALSIPTRRAGGCCR